MTARTFLPSALLALTVLVGTAAAGDGETCGTGPVAVLILSSDQKVREYAASVRNVDVVTRDPSTVVFADGRVVTSDVGAATEHLNTLGWGTRPIKIVASFRTRRARPRSVG